MSLLYTVVLGEVPAIERILAAAKRSGIAVDASAPAGFAMVRDPTGGPSIEVSFGPLDEPTARLHGGAAWSLRLRTPEGRHAWAEWQQAKLTLAFLDALSGRLSVPEGDARQLLNQVRSRAGRPPTGMVDVGGGGRAGDSGALSATDGLPSRLMRRLARAKVTATFIAAGGMLLIAALLVAGGGRQAARPAAVCAGFAIGFGILGLYWARRARASRE